MIMDDNYILLLCLDDNLNFIDDLDDFDVFFLVCFERTLYLVLV
jgi:hypothetical protein